MKVPGGGLRGRSGFSGDLRWGFGHGLRIAGLLLLVTLFMYLARGGGPDPLQFGWLAIAATYLLASLGAGLLLGLLRPINKTLLGHMVIGMACTLPLCGLVIYQMEWKDWYTMPRWIVTCCVTVILGSVYGIAVWMAGRD